MDASNLLLSARRGRWAVAAMFLLNGFTIGSWAPQIPVTLARLQITETTLGLMILGFGAGAVLAMPVAGFLIGRLGSRAVTRGFAVAASAGLLLVALSPNVALASIALFVFGGAQGSMDVAMNANAVEVEKRLGRAVMSSSHGFWSVGGFVGGAIGGPLLERWGHLPHAAVVSALAAIVLAWAWPRLIAEATPAPHEHRPVALPRSVGVYLLGIMALFAMVPEGAVLDWAALYLHQERDADLATAGFAFAAFSGTMAMMRFLGDGVRDYFGAVATLRVSTLVAATGILAGGLASDPWLAIAAFAFAGLGVANIVPIAFSAAGNQPGLSAGAGLSVVTVMGYSGLLFAPSIIGFVGERTGFSPVFVAVAGLLIVVFLLSGLAKAADGARPPA
jgi:fucose permease